MYIQCSYSVHNYGPDERVCTCVHVCVCVCQFIQCNYSCTVGYMSTYVCAPVYICVCICTANHTHCNPMPCAHVALCTANCTASGCVMEQNVMKETREICNLLQMSNKKQKCT